MRGSSHLLKVNYLRGQELLEFALIVPIMFLFIFGVIDLARLFHAYTAITNAAREGARYATVSGMVQNAAMARYDLKTSEIINVVRNETPNMNVSTSSITINCCNSIGACSGTWCQGGSTLIITVDYNFNLFMQGFIPQATIPLRASAKMIVPFIPLY